MTTAVITDCTDSLLPLQPQGAEWCNVDLSAVTTTTDLAILLSFAVRLNGMSLEQVREQSAVSFIVL